MIVQVCVLHASSKLFTHAKMFAGRKAVYRVD